MGQPSGAVKLESVDPHFYGRAKRYEDRLIRLIDGGEDLARWFHRPDVSGLCGARGGALSAGVGGDSGGSEVTGSDRSFPRSKNIGRGSDLQPRGRRSLHAPLHGGVMR